MAKTLVRCLVCPKCGDRIYSRARHDFHHCNCGNIYIDGGFDYMRCGGDVTAKVVRKFIPVSKEELYKDWNEGIDKYGIIKSK